MLGHVDLEAIADPFSASGDQQIVDLFDCAAEGIVFRTAQTDGAELYLGKIRLLLSDLFQQRLKVIRQFAAPCVEETTSQRPVNGSSSSSGPCSISVEKPASSSFSAKCSATYSALPSVLPLIRVMSAMNQRSQPSHSKWLHCTL